MKSAKDLRWDLKSLGLSEAAIDAAWPEWWSEAAEPSVSAQSELRFSLSRKLGLDPKSLLEDEPQFVWNDQAKFKRLTTESALERSALASFGASVGRALISATAENYFKLSPSAGSYRDLILRREPFVSLQSLLSLCWGLGIPVVSLRVFPLNSKRMSAMVVRVNGRFAVLLARESNFPAQISFYLAHELGHAALGHVDNELAVVEFGDTITDQSSDKEEIEADAYALELLTGFKDPAFLAEGSGFNAPALADVSLRSAVDLKIDPGVIALCFGHSTRAWQRVFSAMRMIYGGSRPVWRDVNRIAINQMDWTAVSDDTASFLQSVLGAGLDHASRH